ncbi:hypothetical protein NEIFLAOT_01195 [Neisseria flavescens NRL30031/H210]|uniref:Uncharacterized protein n=1 Tax=Neisseria flavescens NRL30031/H210 TaxID=546264 RepID=C0EMM4_NEIFL|nr:hypothetical protein NEIFLAOT_01195 [Neisseria flavescens NRL30031/H210]
MPYYLYCLRLRRLVLIFVNPLYFLNKRAAKLEKMFEPHRRQTG